MAKGGLEKKVRELETFRKRQNEAQEHTNKALAKLQHVAGLAVSPFVRSVAGEVLHFALEHQPRQFPTTLSFKIGLQDDGALADALRTFKDRYNEGIALLVTAATIAELFDLTIDYGNRKPANDADEASLYNHVIEALQLLDDDPDLKVEMRDQHDVLSHHKLLREAFTFSDETDFNSKPQEVK
jgi:hypothetical protein